MSCKDHTFCFDNPREVFTSLQFGVFLFAFAYFLAFAPLPYLNEGVNVMSESAVTMSDAFALLSDGVNSQVASFVSTEVAICAAVGGSLAYVGGTIGESAAGFVTKPEVFRANLSLNMRTLVRAWAPQSIHQYKWSQSHRFWMGNPKMEFPQMALRQ